MDHATLRQLFYQRLSSHYLQGELQALYHWCALEIEGWTRAEAYLQNEKDVDTDSHARWMGVVERLEREEPIQYIFGKAPFMDFEVIVNPSVLIPRPETEELVAIVLRDHQELRLNVLDVGTGSGCIALALKRQRPHWTVTGMDVSPEALQVAQSNANSLGVDISLVEQDIRQQTDFAPYDLIVSNPPYIPLELEATLDSNVVKYEPHIALFSPKGDEFYFINRIAELASIRGCREVYFETHASDEDDLVQSLQFVWKGEIKVEQDAVGKPRFAH
ncbi:MAG: peptide chain release factor N(5)-glutamine methyltransferase, partial [Cryomorphaceae bacterium]